MLTATPRFSEAAWKQLERQEVFLILLVTPVTQHCLGPVPLVLYRWETD